MGSKMEKAKDKARHNECQRSPETRMERKTLAEFSIEFSRLTAFPSPRTQPRGLGVHSGHERTRRSPSEQP